MTLTALASLHDAAQAIREELAGVIIGQDEVIDQLLVAVLAGQHCLLEAAPGSAKNLLAASLAKALGLRFHRVHCTPDLNPAELISQAVHGAGEQSDAPEEAAALPHVLLVDDVSRLVPAARVVIQQAMLDGFVILDGQRFVAPTPFIVLATKYRQDEEPADVADEPRDDRYMLKIAVRFPSYHDEFHVTAVPSESVPREIQQLLDAERLAQFQETARGVFAPAHVVHYAPRLTRSTRVHEGQTPDFAYEWIAMGAGPRASHHLLTAAKMRAALNGRDFAGIEDIQAMLHCALRHRLVTNQNARANGITPDRVIDRLLYEIPVRIEGDDAPAVPGDAPKFDLTSDDQWMGE